MQRFGNAILVSLTILGAAIPALADEVLTVAADSTLDGHAGFVLHSTPTEDNGSSVFLFEEAGKLRFYATREYGSQDWDILPTPQYLVPTGTINIGETWDFVETDSGEPTQARVTAQETVDTAAGSFSAFRVEIERVADPGVAYQTMWFVWETGFVRSQGFLDGVMDWRDELQSVTIMGGTGYMPMFVGNTWNYVEAPVAADESSWSGIKSIYR